MGKRPSEHTTFLIRQQRRFRNFRRAMFGWLARPVVGVARRLPAFMLLPMMRMVGWPLYWSEGRAARARLAGALGDRQLSPREQRRVLKASCRNLADSVVEATIVTRGGMAALGVPIDDTEAAALIAEYESEHAYGWIGLTGHIGNWELLAHWVTTVSQHPDVHVIAKRAPNPHINRIIADLRDRLHLTTIYQEDPSTRAVRALRDGQVLGVVPDQDVKSLSGMFIDFLGRDAFTPIGPARLAVTARVPIICFFMLRDDSTGGFRVVAHDPLFPNRDTSRGRQIADLTRAWSKIVADTIREHPEQWPWIHDRWKTTPEKLRARGRAEYELCPAPY